MFNKVIMAGNLTRDVDLRYSQSGTALATMGIASNRKFKKQDGSQGEEVCFVDVKLFGRTAEIANQYLKKGSRVLVEGRLAFEQWTNQQGVKCYKHSIMAESIQMLDSKQTDTQTPQSQNDLAQAYQNAQEVDMTPPNGIPEITINDDEMPF